MSNKLFIILPNHMYEDIGTLVQRHNYRYIVFLEEPMLFYDPLHRPIKPNKIKIAYMRACMRYMYSKLQSVAKSIYIDYTDIDHSYSFLDKLRGVNEVCMYDPVDTPLKHKLIEVMRSKKLHIDFLETKNFIMTSEDMNIYAAKNGGNKRQRHSVFYTFVKTKLGILLDTPNMDKYNRSALNKTVYDKSKDAIKLDMEKQYASYYKEAIEYALVLFGHENIGTRETLQNIYMYPISSNAAYSGFKEFLRKHLQFYGKYQDAILKDDNVIYHSCISAALNIGLLNPVKLVEIIMDFHESSPNIPMNSLEGFIRQLIGWREYMRYLYLYFRNDMVNTNIPGNINTFNLWRPWYEGNTGIAPLDNEIKKAAATGYSHHIVRLMVFMNFFILCGLHPYVIYKWFMEVISIDAYDWVMVSNIYAMGFFYNKAMSRPYLSKSTYILKMSDYKRDGYWDKLWDSLFESFVRDKPRAYTFSYLRNLRGSTSINYKNTTLAKEFLKDNVLQIRTSRQRNSVSSDSTGCTSN